MVQQRFPGCLLTALLFATSAALQGQETASSAPGSLAAAAREAAKNFKAIPPQNIATAKADLASAIHQLDRFFKSDTRAKEAGWKKYLRWEDLLGVVQKSEPPAADLIATLLQKFRGEHRGLEMKQFTRVRDALASYGTVVSTAADDAVKDEFGKRLDELAKQLETYAKDPADGDAALAIGSTVGWLARNQQAEQLVASIREAYGQRNFYGYASKRLIAGGIEDDIDQVRGVHENILGTDLHGAARLRGRTTLVLDENPNAATFRILLGGNVVSSNIGYNGPVTIFSSGYTSVAGQKQVVLDAEGMHGYRACVACRTGSTIHSICAKCALIERIAWKKAGQQKGQAEAVASQRASARIGRQMNSQVGESVAEQITRYRDKFRDPLRRRGEFPEEMNFSSHADRAELQMLQESPSLLAAPGAPPELALTHDVGARAHESLVTNFGQGLLGGYELTDLRLEKLIREDLEADVPEELQVTMPDGKLNPDKEPWSIIFAKELPVRAKFSGGGLWLAIRADGFTRGEGDAPGKYKPALTELIEISAQYNIVKTDKGATLRRDGDVKIRFPSRANPDQVTVRDNAIVTFIRRKFRTLYKEEIVGEGIKFKGRFAKVGTLRLQDIKSDQAWITAAWQMATANQPPATATAASHLPQDVDGQLEASLD